MSYKSIKNVAPVSRMGGTQQRIFLAAYADFTTLQNADPITGLIATAHVFPALKGFIELYVTKDTGEVKFETIGGADRHSFMAKGQFYHPGESDDIVAFANQVIRDCRFIVLVPLPGSTELVQIGSNEFQTEIKASYDATKNSGDGRGWTFEFESFMPTFQKYTAGAIVSI